MSSCRPETNSGRGSSFQWQSPIKPPAYRSPRLMNRFSSMTSAGDAEVHQCDRPLSSLGDGPHPTPEAASRRASAFDLIGYLVIDRRRKFTARAMIPFPIFPMTICTSKPQVSHRKSIRNRGRYRNPIRIPSRLRNSPFRLTTHKMRHCQVDAAATNGRPPRNSNICTPMHSIFVA